MIHRRLPLSLLLGACAPAVFAHQAALHHASAVSAFLHPFGGLDHLLAMIVVGAWAARARTSDRFLAPVVFCAALATGALLAAHGRTMVGAEGLIALSLIVLGPLASQAAVVPRRVTVVACALAGFAHGQAHGSELAGLGLALTPWAFVLGSVVLHGCGYAVARGLGRGRAARAVRRVLAYSGFAGLWLLLAS